MPKTTRPDPPEAPFFPEPRTFFWLPIDGQRHAAGTRYRDLPYNELIDTLCEQQLTRVPIAELDWLWPTCPTCCTITAASVGLRA